MAPPDYESGGQEFESLRARHFHLKFQYLCRPAPFSHQLGKDDVFGKANRPISEDTCSPDKFAQLIGYPTKNVAFCQGIANGAVEWRSAPKDAEGYSTSKRFNTELRLIGCIDIDFYECTLCIRRSAAIAKTWSP